MVIDNRFKRRPYALSFTLRQPGAVNGRKNIKKLNRSRCWNVVEYKNRKHWTFLYREGTSLFYIQADFQAPIY